MPIDRACESEFRKRLFIWVVLCILNLFKPRNLSGGFIKEQLYVDYRHDW